MGDWRTQSMYSPVTAPSRRLPKDARVHRTFRLLPALIYCSFDLLFLITSVWLGGQFWKLFDRGIDLWIWTDLWPVLVAFPLVFGWARLYAGGGISPAVEFQRLTSVTLLVFLTVLLVLCLTDDQGTYSRGMFLASLGLSLVLIPAGRALARECFSMKPWWGIPVIVLGTGTSARELIQRLKAQPAIGYNPVACFTYEQTGTDNCLGVPIVGTTSAVASWAKTNRITHVVIAMPELPREQLLSTINEHLHCIPKVIFISPFLGALGFHISKQEFGDLLGLQIQRNLLLPSNRRLKRITDLLITVPLGLIALPIIVLAALIIMVVSPGIPFYSQLREGRRGRTIRVWKLRTMYLDAEARLASMLETSPAAQEEWGQYCKLRHDPRILPVIGQILRKTSLDELPQLYNVLLGEMSLVGPRPFPYYHLDKFEHEFRSLRREVTPGITGLWQITARSDGDLKTQEALDSYYIRDWSIWLDLYLLLRTPWAVVFSKGAY